MTYTTIEERQREADDILEKHGKWLRGEPGGERLVATETLDWSGLSFPDGINLYRAETGDIDLRGAKTGNIDLRGAKTGNIDLRGAKTGNIDLEGAKTGDIYLYRAKTGDIYLGGAKTGTIDLGDAKTGTIDLRGAKTGNIDLEGAKTGDIYLGDAETGDIDLGDAKTGTIDLREAKTGNIYTDTPIPQIPRFEQAMLEAVGHNGENLDMSGWHCGTTHCRAGWAVTLAGEDGAMLEARHGSSMAGVLIYRENTPDGYVPDFYTCDEAALADIKARAEAEKTREVNA